MAALDYTATVTLAMAGLAGLSTGLGFVSSSVSNSNGYIDVQVWLKKTKSAASASPLAAISLHLCPVDHGDVSSSSSVSAVYILNYPLLGSLSLGTTATGSATIGGGPFSVGRAAGGLCPQNFCIGVANESGVALASTAGEHLVVYQGVKTS